jgi:hypothetical protein
MGANTVAGRINKSRTLYSAGSTMGLYKKSSSSTVQNTGFSKFVPFQIAYLHSWISGGSDEERLGFLSPRNGETLSEIPEESLRYQLAAVRDCFKAFGE